MDLFDDGRSLGSRHALAADAVSAAGVGVWSWDRERDTVEWNEQLERLFGLDAGEFGGTFEDFATRVHPDDRGDVLAAIEGAVANTGSFRFDHRCIWPDGSEHWLEGVGRVIIDDAGDATGAIGITLPIDERRSVEHHRVARLQRERERRTLAERLLSHMAALHELAAAAASASSVEDLYTVLIGPARRAIGADTAFIGWIDPDRDRIELRRSANVSNDAIARWRHIPLELRTPVTDVARSGRLLVCDDREDLAARYPAIAQGGAHAVAVLPLRDGDTVRGVVAYVFAAPHRFTDEDEDYLRTAAEVCGQGLARAVLYEATRDAARRSQALARLTSRLAAAGSPLDVAQTIVSEVPAIVGARSAELGVIEGSSGTVETLASSRNDGDARTVAITLALEDGRVGVLDLAFDSLPLLDQDEIAFLDVVAGICGQSLARAEARHEELRTAARLARIQDITELALGRLSTSELLATIPERVASALGCDTVRIFIIDPDSEHLVKRAAFGLPDNPVTMPIGKGIAGRIAHSGRPQRIDDLGHAQVIDPALAAIAASAAGVPLRSGDVVIGVLDVASHAPRHFTDEELALLELAADRIGNAFGRAHAFELERIARERSEYLSSVSEALTRSLDLDELLRVVVQAAVPRIGDWCSVVLVEPDGGLRIEIAHSDPARVPLAHRLQSGFSFDPDAPFGATAVIRTGQAEFYPEITEQMVSAVLDDETSETLAALMLRSAIIVPLRSRSGVLGALQLVYAESGRHFTSDDMTFGRQLADRVGAAIENVRLFSAQRRVAETLQRSLLPGRLPELPGVDVAVRYWPATNETLVGGDFYDIVPIDDRTWGLLIGDVSGKGIAAAALTGVVRHTVRAAARRHLAPAEVLLAVDDAFKAEALDSGEFCTAVYGNLTRDDEGWVWTFAVGGHPRPVLADAHHASYVGHGGTLLGVLRQPKLQQEARRIQPGDVLVLYTDGITDLPGGAVLGEDGLLAAAVEAGAAGDPERLTGLVEAALRHRLDHGARPDDVAVMVLRFR